MLPLAQLLWVEDAPIASGADYQLLKTVSASERFMGPSGVGAGAGGSGAR
jgi:hypothetical protein